MKCVHKTNMPWCPSSIQQFELSLIHSGVCDPKGFEARGESKYFITFIDNYSKYTYVFLLRSKDEVFIVFKEYKTEIEKLIGKSLKELRSNRGGEHLSHMFDSYCQEQGIIQSITPPYFPQSNRIDEQKNRTMVDIVNAMLISSRLPQSLWGEALMNATHKCNRVP